MSGRILRERMLLLALAGAGVVALLAGCGKSGEEGTATPASQPIRVGVVLPLSGELASYGDSTLAGIELRAKQANEGGGLNGRELILEVEDNRNDQDQTISAYKKLVSLKRCVAVVGPITSTNSLAVLNDVTRMETPTISPTATNDAVAPGSPYMFRACYNDSFQGQIIATYAYRDRGFRRAAVLVDKGSDYSMGLAAKFTEVFAELGGEIVAEESYKSKDTEFGTKLAAVKSANADVVFVPGYPGEVVPLLKQAAVMGIEATFCGADGWDHVDIITKSGPKIEGSFFLGAFAKQDPRPEVAAFIAAMKAAGHEDVGTFEALGYDSLSFLIRAMETEGTEPEAIRRGLLALDQAPAVTGATTITAEGDAVKEAAMLGVEKTADGKYSKVLLDHVKP